MSGNNLRLSGYVPTNEAAYLLNSNERSLRRNAKKNVLVSTKDGSNRLWFKVWNNCTEQANEDEIARSTVARRAQGGEYVTTNCDGRTLYSKIVVNPISR